MKPIWVAVSKDGSDDYGQVDACTSEAEMREWAEEYAEAGFTIQKYVPERVVKPDPVAKGVGMCRACRTLVMESSNFCQNCSAKLDWEGEDA